MLSDDEIRALLNVCAEDPHVRGRRTRRSSGCCSNSGCRRAEIAALRWTLATGNERLDLDGRQLRVLGKGRRERLVVIGREAVRALDRYLRTATAEHVMAN